MNCLLNRFALSLLLAFAIAGCSKLPAPESAFELTSPGGHTLANSEQELVSKVQTYLNSIYEREIQFSIIEIVYDDIDDLKKTRAELIMEFEGIGKKNMVFYIPHAQSESALNPIPGSGPPSTAAAIVITCKGKCDDNSPCEVRRDPVTKNDYCTCLGSTFNAGDCEMWVISPPTFPSTVPTKEAFKCTKSCNTAGYNQDCKVTFAGSTLLGHGNRIFCSCNDEHQFAEPACGPPVIVDSTDTVPPAIECIGNCSTGNPCGVYYDLDKYTYGCHCSENTGNCKIKHKDKTYSCTGKCMELNNSTPVSAELQAKWDFLAHCTPIYEETADSETVKCKCLLGYECDSTTVE